MVNCSGCGQKRQTRTCSATMCTFGPWTDAGSCSWCDACGQVVYCDTPDNVVSIMDALRKSVEGEKKARKSR